MKKSIITFLNKLRSKDKTFEEKVKAMSAKEIIMTMVNGLKHEWLEVNMSVFIYYEYKKACGCAAGNAVCEIIGEVPKNNVLADGTEIFLGHIKGDREFICKVLIAYDHLRMGNISAYNYFAEKKGFAILKEPSTKLPYLTGNNWKENLQAYVDFANSKD